MIANPALPRAIPTPVPVAIPLKEWLPWALFAGVIMLALLYLVGVEQGATALMNNAYVHEWVHDSRHLLGFPCH